MKNVLHLVAPLITKQFISTNSYWSRKAAFTDSVTPPVPSQRQRVNGVVIVYAPPTSLINSYGVTTGPNLSTGNARIWECAHLPEFTQIYDLEPYMSQQKPVFGNPVKHEIDKWITTGSPSQKLLSLIYRVQDRAWRAEIKHTVLQYMAGELSDTDLLAVTLPPYISKFLESTEVKAVRANILAGNTESFECRYVLRSLKNTTKTNA